MTVSNVTLAVLIAVTFKWALIAYLIWLNKETMK